MQRPPGDRAHSARRPEPRPGIAVPRRFARAPAVPLATPAGIELEVVVAERFAARLLGLAGLAPAAAPPLLIPRCRSVHTFGMRFAIDVAFIATDREPRPVVVALRAGIAPGRLAGAGRRPKGGARIAALELVAGRAAALGIAPGAELVLADAGDHFDGSRQAVG